MVVLISIPLMLIHFLCTIPEIITVRKANKDLGTMTKIILTQGIPRKGLLSPQGVKSLIKPVEKYQMCFQH